MKQHMIECVQEMYIGQMHDCAITYYNDKKYEISVYDEWDDEDESDSFSAYMSCDEGVYFLHFNNYKRDADGYIIEATDGIFGEEETA